MRFEGQIQYDPVIAIIFKPYSVVYISNIEGLIVKVVPQLYGQGEISHDEVMGNMHPEPV